MGRAVLLAIVGLFVIVAGCGGEGVATRCVDNHTHMQPSMCGNVPCTIATNHCHQTQYWNETNETWVNDSNRSG